jgi:putative transposase
MPGLLHKLAIRRANQVWVLDTTYFPMARGFIYITAVVDVASSKVQNTKVVMVVQHSFCNFPDHGN